MVNKTILLGRVGKDPEVRDVNGTSVANFSLATNESWKDKEGAKQEKVTWHNIQAWRGLADVIGKYVKKGDLVYIEGKISNRSYEKDGETKYITEIIANDMKMLGGKKDSDSTQGAPVPTSVPAETTINNLPF